MKRVFPQSIQGRLALLVGALTLTAAVTTLLVHLGINNYVERALPL